MTLSVSGGRLLLDGQRFRHVGVNAAYMLARRWYSASDTQYIEDLDILADNDIKVIRCIAIPNAAGTGGGLATWGTSTGLSASFYTAQDTIFNYAATKGVQIIPVLFGNYWAIANYKSEKLNQLGVSASATRAYMRTCAAEYVAHYAGYASVAAWEIGNEWNNYAELSAYPSGNDYTGSAYSADSANLITMGDLRAALADVATTIKSNDATRCVISGNGGPWFTSKAALDGLEGTVKYLNPDPIDTLCVHLYSNPTNNVWLRNGYATLPEIVGRLKLAGKAVGKPLVLGEVGVSEAIPTKVSDELILGEFLGKPGAPDLTLLWNFYKPGSALPDSNTNYDFYSTGDRTRFLSMVATANRRAFSNATPISGAFPTQYMVCAGAQCVYTDMPSFNGNFTLSLWVRHDTNRNDNFPRIVSATSNESDNGFIVVELSRSASAAEFGEPYFRVFAGSGQSATLRSQPIQSRRWTHRCYVWKYWTDTFTASTSTDVLTMPTGSAYLQTGDVVRVSTTGTLPTASSGILSNSTDYYVIRTSDTAIKFASTQGDAYMGTALDITDAGSGTHTITSRYVSVYVNGIKATPDMATTFTGAWANPTGNFVIGASRTAAADFFRGHLAKVRLWHRGLSELDVFWDYVGNTPSGHTSYLVDGFGSMTQVGSPEWRTDGARTISTRSVSARTMEDRFVSSRRPVVI